MNKDSQEKSQTLRDTTGLQRNMCDNANNIGKNLFQYEKETSFGVLKSDRNGQKAIGRAARYSDRVI